MRTTGDCTDRRLILHRRLAIREELREELYCTFQRSHLLNELLYRFFERVWGLGARVKVPTSFF